MVAITLKVSAADGCMDCPLHWYNDDGWRCGARPKRKAFHGDGSAPRWCPLKARDVVVTMKGGE